MKRIYSYLLLLNKAQEAYRMWVNGKKQILIIVLFAKCKFMQSIAIVPKLYPTKTPVKLP